MKNGTAKNYSYSDTLSALQKGKEKIKNVEHRFNALMENSDEVIAILSEKGDVLYISPSVKKVSGYTEEEALEMNVFTMIHPKDVPSMVTFFRQVTANAGVPVKGHIGRLQRKDGSLCWLEATVTNMLHDPLIKGIVANCRDITEVKLGEEKLIYANRLYAFSAL